MNHEYQFLYSDWPLTQTSASFTTLQGHYFWLIKEELWPSEQDLLLNFSPLKFVVKKVDILYVISVKTLVIDCFTFLSLHALEIKPPSSPC